MRPERLEDFLAAHPGVELSSTPPRRPLLDVSQGWVGGATYRSTTGRDGKGVVVGLVDTGLDVRHPDFRNADGSSRVAWMLASGTPRGVHPDVERSALCDDPATSSCGIWSAHDIDAAADADLVSVMRDADGHGTHVSSIAAGNGGAREEIRGHGARRGRRDVGASVRRGVLRHGHPERRALRVRARRQHADVPRRAHAVRSRRVHVRRRRHVRRRLHGRDVPGARAGPLPRRARDRLHRAGLRARRVHADALAVRAELEPRRRLRRARRYERSRARPRRARGERARPRHRRRRRQQRRDLPCRTTAPARSGSTRRRSCPRTRTCACR